jgi:hypothetical protein
MKLRLDLLKHLTTEDIAQAAEATVHRFKPEPLFSRTGVGSLSPTSTEDRVREEAHSKELTRKLEERARKSGEKGTKKS